MTPVGGGEPRIWDALTDLYTYALALDAEWRPLVRDLAALPDGDAAEAERTKLERRHREIGEELEALREAIAMLRAHADAVGAQPSAPAAMTQPPSSQAA